MQTMRLRITSVATLTCIAIALSMSPTMFRPIAEAKALPFSRMATISVASRPPSEMPEIVTRNRAGEVTQEFKVGEEVKIEIRNVMEEEAVTIVTRSKSRPGRLLMAREGIKVQRLSSGNYREISANDYAVLMDDDGAERFKPLKREVAPNAVYTCSWRPRIPGRYRIEVTYYPGDRYRMVRSTHSKSFFVVRA
jgi:hypothetical protein